MRPAQKKLRSESKPMMDEESTPQSIFMRIWGRYGTADGQFDQPQGIAVGTDGTVYVSDYGNCRIQCFDREGRFLRKWGHQGTGSGEFTRGPSGLASTRGDGVDEAVAEKMRQIPELCRLPPGLLPICVAYLGCSLLIVTEKIKEEVDDRIQLFKSDGTFIRKWSGEARDCEYCCVDDSGTIYVADWIHGCIRTLRMDEPLSSFCCFMSDLGRPGPMTVTSRDLYFIQHGKVYQVRLQTPSLITQERAYVHRWWSIIADEESSVFYLLDASSLHQFRLNDKFARKWEHAVGGQTNFCAMAKGPDNLIYIIDSQQQQIGILNTQEVKQRTLLDMWPTFSCSQCYSKKYETVADDRYGSVWKCRKCRCVDTNSSLYRPCLTCGGIYFVSYAHSRGGRQIRCRKCDTLAVGINPTVFVQTPD